MGIIAAAAISMSDYYGAPDDVYTLPAVGALSFTIFGLLAGNDYFGRRHRRCKRGAHDAAAPQII